MTVIGLLFTNNSFAMAQTIKANKIKSIQVVVQGCNIIFDKSTGTSKSLDVNYYGKASSSKYKLKTSTKNGVVKIDVDYIGSGMAPTVEEGGIIVKIPKIEVLTLDITGKNSGITLNNMNFDTNLKTESSAVTITNKKSENKMTIDSKNDSYEIKSVPPTKDIHIKVDSSAIDYKLSQAPANLKFKLTNHRGSVVIPKNWNYDYSIGSGKPNMVIDNVDGSFELHY